MAEVFENFEPEQTAQKTADIFVQIDSLTDVQCFDILVSSNKGNALIYGGIYHGNLHK